jgi:MFS transporter, DHA1 family, multidrug resistance protein
VEYGGHRDRRFLSVLLPLSVVLFALALMLPNAPVLALADHGDTAGSAAALVGAAQFGTAALILASTIMALIGRRQRRSSPAERRMSL